MSDDSKFFREIPKYFYSFHDEKPFSHCIECEKYLLGEDTEYLIERVFRNYPGYKAKDVIFDYAICMDCAMKLQNEMSKESQQSLKNYFSENVDLKQRQVLVNENTEVDQAIARCMVKGTPAEESEEYQVCAHCIGNKIYMGNPPYMISGSVMEEILEILSTHTRDILNGFYQKHFSPAPGLFEPDPRLILF